ncbi:MAG: carbamoyltransferase [Acidobacteria bacterium]|nr:carbamoyltransferase [Acidobacteriota bacterium]
MYILGINAYHGDASATIIKDGKLIAAAEEERFNRFKHCAGFPALAIKYCLAAAGIGIEQVDHIGISRNPSANLSNKILFSAKKAISSLWGGEAESGGQSGFKRLSERLASVGKVRNFKDDLAQQLGVDKNQIRAELHHVEHHRAHLASCFFVSPFERAALLSLDGFGDFVSTMWGVGAGTKFEVQGQVEFPHSTGILYTATTQFIGFPWYGDEGKVMGLAPYGKPRFIEQFRDIIRAAEGGRFTLNLDYFRHHTDGVEMSWDEGSPVIGTIFSEAYAKTFGPARQPGEPLTEREHDIAASLQLRLEEIGFHLLNQLHATTGLTDLGLAGGVALNSVMNGKIMLNTPFKNVYVQPAAGDNGTSLGVCYYIWNQTLNQPRGEVMEGAYTGPEYSNDEIRAVLDQYELAYESYTDREVTQRAAQDIADGLVVGWFQGRMEFGPRALGNRSIVVDPRRADMKDILNQRIKKREPFRPFAPSILAEHTGEYFEQTHPAPTMLMVYQIKPEKRALIPAVTHVDGSGRLQTVTPSVNPRYYQLIADFHALTGVPIILNTSFNENEPIVCTPQHAIDCFLKTRMDVLYVGNHALRRRPGGS